VSRGDVGLMGRSVTGGEVVAIGEKCWLFERGDGQGKKCWLGEKW
jgi:hypothetical protein